MEKNTIRDVSAPGKRVLVRVDFNVPLDDAGKITDDRRIRESLPTLNTLLDNGAAVVAMSHLGRPKGKVVESLRLRPVGELLAALLGRPVDILPDCVGDLVSARVAALSPGGVALLENLRFHPEEEKNDPAFAMRLASLGDLYVNDAFGTAHRAHASTEGVAHYLPAVAGLLMEKEVRYLSRMLEAPDRPFVAVLGGKKVSDKIGVIRNLLGLANTVLIGGGMAYTFLRAKGYEIGASLLEAEKLDLAKELLEEAQKGGVQFLIPTDVVVADKVAEDARTRVVPANAIPEGMIGLDIGPATSAEYGHVIRSAGMVVWNGPMGVFELSPFAGGTRAVAEALTACRGTTIVGGGDSAAAIEQMGFAERIDHISTGGGASLEFMEGQQLPGISVLADK
ncbi:MAG: phosphoglycerate kinase [Armatimonadetes bacterium]|nr:phosphoglycerate kinase [Armatimonadota bacterium]